MPAKIKPVREDLHVENLGPFKAQYGYITGFYEDKGEFHIADVRGYGFLTGHGAGGLKMGPNEATNVRLYWAQEIAAALNWRRTISQIEVRDE